MFSLEIIYQLDKAKPLESSGVIQYIKHTLSILTDGYTQATDSATKPTQYTFSIQLSSQIASDIKRRLDILPQDHLTRIKVTKK